MSSQSVRSKSNRALKATLDVPVWSQITTNPDIQNRGVKYGMRATLGRAPGTPSARESDLGCSTTPRTKCSRYVVLGPIRSTKIASDCRRGENQDGFPNERTVSLRRQNTVECARTRRVANLHVSLTKPRGRVRGPLIDSDGGRVEVVGTRAGQNLHLCI